jgi:hypothetical protein
MYGEIILLIFKNIVTLNAKLELSRYTQSLATIKTGKPYTIIISASEKPLPLRPSSPSIHNSLSSLPPAQPLPV